MNGPTIHRSRLTAAARAALYLTFTIALIPIQAVSLALRLPLSR